MDALTPILVVLSFLLLGVAILAAELFLARRHLRELRIVRCPAVSRAAALRLRAGWAAMEAALGRAPEMEVADCTRWPRAKGCGRECLEQLEGDPEEATLADRVRRWMGEKTCAGCGAAFREGEIFLVSPLGTRFEWSELPPDWLADAMENWVPLCGACGRGDERAGTVSERMIVP